METIIACTAFSNKWTVVSCFITKQTQIENPNCFAECALSKYPSAKIVLDDNNYLTFWVCKLSYRTGKLIIQMQNSVQSLSSLCMRVYSYDYCEGNSTLSFYLTTNFHSSFSAGPPYHWFT